MLLCDFVHVWHINTTAPPPPTIRNHVVIILLGRCIALCPLSICVLCNILLYSKEMCGTTESHKWGEAQDVQWLSSNVNLDGWIPGNCSPHDEVLLGETLINELKKAVLWVCECLSEWWSLLMECSSRCHQCMNVFNWRVVSLCCKTKNKIRAKNAF